MIQYHGYRHLAGRNILQPPGQLESSSARALHLAETSSLSSPVSYPVPMLYQCDRAYLRLPFSCVHRRLRGIDDDIEDKVV